MKGVIFTAVLCDRCIQAIRSRGEKVYVGNLSDNEHTHICMWCEAPDDELFKVMFKKPSYTDDDYTSRKRRR